MAVQVKVVAQHMTVQAGVYIEEPSRFRIVIPTLQIIQFGLGVVVIPTIAEGVISPHDAFLHRRRIGCRAEGKISPGVIRIRTDFLSGGIIDGYDISLQVLLEVVGVKRIRSIGLVSVLQPDGSAVLIIEVYKEVVRGLRATTALRRPCLGDDLGAVQRVVVDRTAICLDGSDAIGVIREGIQELSPVHGHLHEFATVPLQRIPVVGGGVADGVILIYRRTDLCQPVAGIIVRLGRGCVTRCARRIRIFFLTKPIACVVVGIHVGLVQVRVILPRQLSQLIVGIPRHLAALVGDPCDIAVGVVGIRVCGRGAVHLRPVRADLPGGAPAAELPVPVAHRLGEACIFIRRGGFLRQAVHAVVPVRYGRPVAQTATENLQLGQRTDAASVSAGSTVVIRIPVAHSIIVVRFAVLHESAILLFSPICDQCPIAFHSHIVYTASMLSHFIVMLIISDPPYIVGGIIINFRSVSKAFEIVKFIF